MQRTTIDFGIDLGTTNSTIAIIDGIDANVIPNKFGSTVTPSAVWIDKRGNIHVGQESKQRALVDDPENADVEFKLRMGLGEDAKKVFQRSGREMLPEELSAEVLKSLKMDIQTNMGEQLNAAVITVPAAFENPSTNATQKAAKLAGFSVSPLLLEPVAASLAYGFQSENENVYWLVYDFGGGTFDAAVMRIRDGLIQVVNHDGDNFLGGKLIDWDIVTKVLAPAAGEQFNLPEFSRGTPQWKHAFGKLKYHAEQAKIDVCRSKTPCEIWIENLCQDADGNDVDFAYTLTPEEVERVSKPHIARTLTLCSKTLEQAGLNGTDMERILMVGGTSLNPWVREAVQSEVGSQAEFGIDPVTVVARGAAIFASTQTLPENLGVAVPAGTWRIQVEHTPVGNLADPDIGGRVVAPEGETAEDCTIELVDTKSQWRSGRITLGADGIFMTQLFAEKKRRCVYAIELCDPTGSRIPTAPDSIAYTIGVPPDEHPPAPMTIGVGLANGSVAKYIEKGQSLPARKSLDHLTQVSLTAGEASDELRIPLLEGEHLRAERNHGIGSLIVCGTDVRRNLPINSEIEITVIMNKDQQILVQAFVPLLDEDFEISFDPQMTHNSLECLEEQVEEQKERLTKVRTKANRTGDAKAKEALDRIDDQELVEHVTALGEAATNDPDAVAQLDRRVRELAAAIDDVEDAVEWPELLENAEEARRETEQVVEERGEAGDRKALRQLTDELQKAIDTGDPELLRRSIERLYDLRYQVLDRHVGYHVAVFEHLAERGHMMRDQARAEQLIAQGRRAINNNDIVALKAANRQLWALLPPEERNESSHVNIGGTMTRG